MTRLYDENGEPIRCGVGFWATGEEDPFIPACEWHDKAYLKDSWAQANISRLKTDRTFYAHMLQIAGDNRLLKARAYAYYMLARAFGSDFWEKDYD